MTIALEGWADDHYFYNGVRLSEVISPRGLKKMGTENVGSFFTRGILIDIAALKGVDRLDLAYPITMDDYRAALAAPGYRGCHPRRRGAVQDRLEPLVEG